MGSQGWKKGRLVGKGASGSVYEAWDIASQTLFCVKQVEFTEDFADSPADLQRLEALRREVDLLKELHHPHVVKFLGIDRVGFVMFIQMEYINGGSVQDLVREAGPLPEQTAARLTRAVLEGLKYLHEDRNVIHRDIKGANILISLDGAVKLADFGAAKRALDGEQLYKTLAGTPYWMAPEVVRQEGHHKAADIWSLGATVLEMLTGFAPYQSLPPIPALFRIGHGKDSPVPDTVTNISKEARAFMLDCMTRDVAQRPTVAQLLQHPWLKGLNASDATQPSSLVPIPQEEGLIRRKFVDFIADRHKALQQEDEASHRVAPAVPPARGASSGKQQQVTSSVALPPPVNHNNSSNNTATQGSRPRPPPPPPPPPPRTDHYRAESDDEEDDDDAMNSERNLDHPQAHSRDREEGTSQRQKAAQHPIDGDIDVPHGDGEEDELDLDDFVAGLASGKAYS